MQEVYGIIVTTWPEVNAQMREVRAARINWQNLIEEFQQNGTGGLEPPYVVVMAGIKEPEREFAPLDDSWFRLPIMVFYIANAPVETIEAKIEALQDAFDPGTTFSWFQTTDHGSIDASEGNPAMEVFLQANVPLAAGMFSTSLMTQ